MLFRFSLYGFLKNQRYFEPFLLLAFLEKGLTFAEIGLLIGFREICVNFMEVPTGAIADVIGRRRAMILSLLAYIAAFAVFGLMRPLWSLALAMFFFSVGEAFRTGTHKAIIFDWLASQGRAKEKTKVYGFTRSWSQIGSAVSVVIAGVMVYTMRRYSVIFLFSIIPYAMNIVNFLTYPSALDGPRQEHPSVRGIVRVLWASLRDSLRQRPLRRLMVEGMGFDGTHKAVKDYLQPVLKTAAISLPVLVGVTDDKQRIAILVGGVYFVLYLLSSAASRRSDWLARLAGSEARAARWLWWGNLGIFAVLTAGVGLGVSAAAILAFVALSLIENSWRPILISRFADYADPAKTATVLSIESQARSLFAAVLAPLLGLAVDQLAAIRVPNGADLRFLPIGLVGLVVASIMLATGRREPRPAREAGESPAE